MLCLLGGGDLYSSEGVMLMILLDQPQSLYVVSRFPCVVTFRVSHPLYKILQLFSSPMMLVAADGLNLILFIIINEVRWWSGVVFAMFARFDMWG